MIQLAKFTFNPFQENTFVLYDETKECVIIDPGCQSKEEKDYLFSFIQNNDLKPVRLLNTHCHLDHIFGNNFVHKTWNLELGIHPLDVPTLALAPKACEMYGIRNYELSPEPGYFINEGDQIRFGNSTLDVIFGPGHAPGHIAFYAKEDGFLVNGDILFQGSYGRTDLPGGDFNVLKDTIVNKLFLLPDETVVLSGHGGETTIGAERTSNPILMGWGN